jgi:predicted metalloprotease with PDZ domain
VFGEFASYDTGTYTFIADYLPWSAGDGMEHRNSTIVTSAASLRTQGRDLLDAVSHEFFHSWNVERIRPRSLEPFDFERANMSGELWLAEGFTQYYGPLLLYRAGLGQQAPTGAAIAVTNSSGRLVRSAVQMSEYAPFSDAATSVDLTDANRTFLSYYTYGAGIALALDLSLRDRTGGLKSLDDFMRAMWIRHGKPGGPAPGLVAKPYTLQDLRTVLAEVSGDAAFAKTFFDKYVEGREAADYPALLGKAGYVMRASAPERGWIGNVGVQPVNGGLSVGVGGGRGGGGGRPSPVPFNTPLYKAGVDEGDIITTIDGQPATPAAWTAINQRKPGDKIALGVQRRDGKAVIVTATLEADPAIAVSLVEAQAADTLTPAQKAFRDGWLGSRIK